MLSYLYHVLVYLYTILFYCFVVHLIKKKNMHQIAEFVKESQAQLGAPKRINTMQALKWRFLYDILLCIERSARNL